MVILNVRGFYLIFEKKNDFLPAEKIYYDKILKVNLFNI